MCISGELKGEKSYFCFSTEFHSKELFRKEMRKE